MLNNKDRICNTIIWQISRVTDIVGYVINSKWKWTGYITQTNDNRWAIRNTKWQIKGVR